MIDLDQHQNSLVDLHHHHLISEVVLPIKGVVHRHHPLQINALLGHRLPLLINVLVGLRHPLQINEMDLPRPHQTNEVVHHLHQINEVALRLHPQILEVDHLLPLMHGLLRLSEVILPLRHLQLATEVDLQLLLLQTEEPLLPHHLGVEACLLLHHLIELRYLNLFLNKNHSQPFSKKHFPNRRVKIQHNHTLILIRQLMHHQHQRLLCFKPHSLLPPQIDLPLPPLVEEEMLF